MPFRCSWWQCTPCGVSSCSSAGPSGTRTSSIASSTIGWRAVLSADSSCTPKVGLSAQWAPCDRRLQKSWGTWEHLLVLASGHKLRCTFRRTHRAPHWCQDCTDLRKQGLERRNDAGYELSFATRGRPLCSIRCREKQRRRRGAQSADRVEGAAL
jgi:hypothetical protein